MVLDQLPSHQTGIITLPNLTLGVSSNVPIPDLRDDDMILVHNQAVGLNPTDFKMPAAFPSPGAVDGADFAGNVIRVGPNVTKWRVGDRVFGAVQGANPQNHEAGAFQEYVSTYAREVLRIPDSMSYETAASIGGAGMGTAAVSLYCSLGIQPLPLGDPPAKRLHVLIYGGSTATGIMAIQMVRLSGHIPIATCSPHNFDFVKSYGAEAVFDYHSRTCAADIKAYTGNTLGHALDCITIPSSMKICYDSMGRMGGRYTAIELPPELPGLRKVVKRDWVMGMTIAGRPVELGKGYEFPVIPQHAEFGRIWGPLCQKLIDEGWIKPHRVRECEGGWEGILRGLEELKMKKVSAEKLVYRVRWT